MPENMERIAILQKIHPLSEGAASQIAAICEETIVEKNQVIIEAQKTARYLYFIRSGICRIFYQKDDRDIVLDFCFPTDVVLSLNSYIHRRPGYEQVDALEQSVLYRIAIDKINQLYKESLEIANWGRKLAELETLKIEERLMQQLFKSAKERYVDLLQKEPLLLHRIKLGHIASYLGVSQVTLSRIRAEIR